MLDQAELRVKAIDLMPRLSRTPVKHGSRRERLADFTARREQIASLSFLSFSTAL